MAQIANPIAQKLSAVAKRLKAIAVIDGPNDATELKIFQNLNGNPRLYIVSPTAKIADGDKVIDVPASSYIAGVFARIKVGESPSNQLIEGILGTSVPISFEVDDPETTAQQYNAMQVATIVRDNGFRVWGVRGSGDPNDLKTNQIQKVRISDSIEEALITSNSWALARGLTIRLVDAVEQKVNDYLRDLKLVDEAIIGGKCERDPNRNTPDSIASGKYYWKYDFTPVAVAETLYFEGFNTTAYYKDLA